MGVTKPFRPTHDRGEAEWTLALRSSGGRRVIVAHSPMIPKREGGGETTSECWHCGLRCCRIVIRPSAESWIHPPLRLVAFFLGISPCQSMTSLHQLAASTLTTGLSLYFRS